MPLTKWLQKNPPPTEVRWSRWWTDMQGKQNRACLDCGYNERVGHHSPLCPMATDEERLKYVKFVSDERRHFKQTEARLKAELTAALDRCNTFRRENAALRRKLQPALLPEKQPESPRLKAERSNATPAEGNYQSAINSEKVDNTPEEQSA